MARYQHRFANVRLMMEKLCTKMATAKLKFYMIKMFT